MRNLLKLAYVALIFAGCGENADLPKYPDANSYCRGRAQAECNDTVVAVCAAPSKDKCVASRQAACNALVPTGKSYDFHKSEDCISRVSAAYGDAKVIKDEIKNYSESCDLLFNGAGIKDAACSEDGDCKVSDGLRCVLGADSAFGTCQTPKPTQGGASCGTVDTQCIAGYHCGATKHCDINADVNEPCSPTLPCRLNLKCSASTDKCEAKIADGSPCAVNADCTSGICLEGTNICVSQITLAPNEPFCKAAR